MQSIRLVLARSERAIAWVGWAGAVLSSVVLLVMVALVFGDIVLRALTGQSLDFITVVVGYAVAAITFGSLAYAFRNGELIRVSLLAGVLRRHPVLDKALYCITLILSIGIMGVVAWYFWLSVARTWTRGVVSATTAELPLWVPEGVMLIGIVLFLIQVALQLLNALVGNSDQAGATLGDMVTETDLHTGPH